MSRSRTQRAPSCAPGRLRHEWDPDGEQLPLTTRGSERTATDRCRWCGTVRRQRWAAGLERPHVVIYARGVKP